MIRKVLKKYKKIDKEGKKMKQIVEVKLLDYYVPGGSSATKFIADIARVSGVPEKMKDEQILEMIVENDYSSCLEHIVFTFDIVMSKLIAPEFLEHRIASHTAKSTRFTRNRDVGYVVPPKISDKKEFLQLYHIALDQAIKFYEELRHYGVSREISRYILPISIKTRYIWTINARSLINFLGLRLCCRASPEMQEMARKILKLTREVCPEIFNRIECRGYNLGVCPENENRPRFCYHPEIPSKKEIKKTWKNRGKSILEQKMRFK